MSSDDPLSRVSILGGELGGRRAATVLFAVESRVGELLDESYRAAAGGAAAGVDTREASFLTALASGREVRRPLRPQEIERYADRWGDLVPETATGAAALATALLAKYPMPYHAAVETRCSLRLDDDDVRRAVEARLGAREGLPWVEPTPIVRTRWALAAVTTWFEHLPPFWTAFALVLTKLIGGAIIALPVAFAAMGTGPAIVLLVLVAAVSLVTVDGFAEAVTRTALMQTRAAYLSTLAREYFGRGAADLMAIVVFVGGGLTLVALTIGVGDAFASASGWPSWIFALLLTAAVLALRRKTATPSVGVALVLGTVTVGVLVALMAAAVPHMSSTEVDEVALPFVDGRGADFALVGGSIGLTFTLFAAHVGVANAAASSLRGDPSGRALRRGACAAMVTTTLLAIAFVVVVQAAVDHDVLAATTEPALVPLADVAGPVVALLGLVYVVTALCTVVLQIALGVVNQTDEWLTQLRLPARFRSAPLLAFFALALGLILTGTDSFVDLFAAQAVFTIPFVIGAIVVPLVLAARRQGDRFATTPRLTAPRAVLVIVFALNWAAIAVHIAPVWDEPLLRSLAALDAIVTIVVFTRLWSRARRTRTVLDIAVSERADAPIECSFLRAGRPVDLEVELRQGDTTEHTTVVDGAVSRVGAVDSLRVVLGDAHGEVFVRARGTDRTGRAAPLRATVVLETDEGEHAFEHPERGAAVQGTAVRLDFRRSRS